jgi:hypothetical protein
MIVIVGAVAVAVDRSILPGVCAKRVPDRAAAAVFVDGALDLIGRGGGAPHKAFRETGRGVPVGRLCLRPGRFAGVAAIPSAEKPASLAKCRRENFPNIDFSRQVRVLPACVPAGDMIVRFDRRKSCRSRIRHVAGDSAVDESHALKVFEPIARLTIMYIGSSKPTGTLISTPAAVDEIDDAIALPQHAVVVEFGRCVRHREVEPAAFHAPVAGIRQCVVITMSPGRCPRPSITSISGGQPPSSASIQNAGHVTKGSDLLVAALENEGVDRIFGVPGEENLDVLESLRARRSSWC